MTKLVSILLPTYNGETRIKTALASVLSQSYGDWELLVLDDGSSDNTADIVKSYAQEDSRIKYFKNEINLGIQKSLNRGIKESKGEYIARIDDDDAWCDVDKLKKQVEFLDQNPDYVLVGTGVIMINEAGKELFRYFVPETDKEIKKQLLAKNCFVHSSVMFRKDAALKFGGYDETEFAKNTEDYNLWLKLGTIGKLHNLPIYGVRFTLREGSISSQNKLDQFKKSLNFIKGYKNVYPNYYYAYLRSVARIIVYGFILKSPIKFSFARLLNFYKKNL